MIKITKTPNADTRTATKPLDKDTLLKNSREHIKHVQTGMGFFGSMVDDASQKHDWTKIEYIDEFAQDAASGSFGADFKKLPWFRRHVATERHHIHDRCPDDVNLIDLLERIADTVMAGLARSGQIYDDVVPDELLQKAYRNTIELLKRNVQVSDD